MAGFPISGHITLLSTVAQPSVYHNILLWSRRTNFVRSLRLSAHSSTPDTEHIIIAIICSSLPLIASTTTPIIGVVSCTEYQVRRPSPAITFEASAVYAPHPQGRERVYLCK